MESEPLNVYNELFGIDIDVEHYKGGVEKAILKKLKLIKESYDK